MQREREADDAHGACLACRAARYARAGRAPADDERQPAETPRAQLRDDLEPRRVEARRRRRGTTAGNSIGLFDERDTHALRERRFGCRDEIGRRHSTARAVPEHEQCTRVAGAVDVRARRPF